MKPADAVVFYRKTIADKRYANEAAQQEAIEREIDSWFDEVPDLFEELVRHQFYKDAQFAENCELIALKIIQERNLP